SIRARIARPPTDRSDFCVWSVRGASRRATPAARMIAVTSCSTPGPGASGSLGRACVLRAYSILCVTEMTQDRHERSTRRSETAVVPGPTPSQQRAVFERDGFVVVPGLFDAQEIARISAWTDELEEAPEVPGRAMKYYEPSLLRPGERVLQRIENLPVPRRVRRAVRRRQAPGLGIAPAGGGRGPLQGQDQLQAPGRRRLQAASGSAGRLEHL